MILNTIGEIRMRELVQVLGFLGALRNYGYIDRVGNAVDEVTLHEALKDAIRAYLSQCIEISSKCVELEKNVGILCPEIDPEKLEASVNLLVREARKSKTDLLKTSRSLALEAYSAIPRIRLKNTCTPSGGSQ